MTLTKRTYTDFDSNTPIIAQNLNDIQDEIIRNAADIATNASDIATNTADIATNADDIDALETTVGALGSELVSGSWIATSSTGVVALTDTLTLTKGTWICVVMTPVCGSDCFGILRTKSGTTTLNSNHYALCDSEDSIVRIFKVSSDTATIRFEAEGSIARTYSYTERGGIIAVKLSS